MSHIARTKRGRVTPRLVVVANVVIAAWWTTLAVMVDLILNLHFSIHIVSRYGSNGWSLLSEISRRCLITSRTLKERKCMYALVIFFTTKTTWQDYIHCRS